MPNYKVLHGDCRQVMAKARDNGIDAIVTDPPYELGFMGKGWDKSGIAYDPEVWKQALRVLKPGGLLLAFGGTRTYHRMACAIEDAGFTVRDCLQWIYGSGFPKSLDISKALDKAAGATREVVGRYQSPQFAERGYEYNAEGTRARHKDVNDRTVPIGNCDWEGRVLTAPATDLARQWDGWGTALKPAYEPIVLAQKPLEGTYAANVAKWGVGALNIGASRVDYQSDADKASATPQGKVTAKSGALAGGTQHDGDRAEFTRPELLGRWPANVLLDDAAAEVLDAQTGTLKSGTLPAHQVNRTKGNTYGKPTQKDETGRVWGGDSGGASRFFYVAKASRADRDYGCDELPIKSAGEALDRKEGSAGLAHARAGANHGGARNFHPTVKPLTLMRYLVRMITPPGGTVLDPFAGSGSTGVGAVLEGFSWVGIELTEDYLPIIRARVGRAYADAYPVEAAAD